MAIQKYEEMGDLAIDMLKEIGSIGGGNAATALSSMLNAKVNMALPEVSHQLSRRSPLSTTWYHRPESLS